MKHKFIITTIMSFLFSLGLVAQTQVTISGVVVDSKSDEPLVGAAILEKGTENGVTTDFNGEFTIKVRQGATLEISYLGYDSQTMVAGSTNSILQIKLVEKTRELDEVVVIGYGVQRKSDITGSISSIAGEDISSLPISSSVQALQGKAAGVQIVQNTGSPGARTTIKIRGTGTINDSDPLYVVDGFIVDGIEHINPNDIANIEILKDAASGSIYGSRGANGVVLITTKKGTAGKLKINFDSYVGFSNPWRKIEVMGVEDFAVMRDYVEDRTSYSADGKVYYSKDPSTGELVYDAGKFQRIDSLKRNSPDSWWDAIIQTGVKQQYNLSFSGGNELHRYMISGNYFNETGVVQTSAYQRFSTRINLSNSLTKWLSMQTNMLYTNDDRAIVPEGQNGVLKRALHQSPLVFTYNTAGYFSENHPIAQIARNHNDAANNRFDINTELTAKINKYLTYQFKVSEYANFYSRKQFTEVGKLEENFVMPTDFTVIEIDQTRTNKWELNNILSFNWNDKIHSINGVVGHTVEGYSFNVQDMTRKGTSANTDNFWYLSAGYAGDLARETEYRWKALGLLSRLNYSYADKYLVQLNFRADASSKFSPANRWGYFPSVSLGWKFSGESFMEGAADWLSLGKLRVGWGQLGNNRIGEYAQYTLINNQFNYVYGAGNHVVYPGATSTTLGNPDIRWEKTESTNIGLDMNFFSNRLSTTIEVFDKYTTDMLLRVPVVASAGLVNAPMINAGSVRNRGIELQMNYRERINKLKFEFGFNVSYIQNSVVSLGSGNEPVWGAYLEEDRILDFVTKTEVNRPIGNFYGYITDGIFNTMEEVQASAQNDGLTFPGDFRFKDLNNDGRITAEDRTFLGSPHPDFVFGIPLSVSYANFDLNLFFQGQTGNKIFNVMEYYLNSAHGTGNVYANIRSNHWAGSYIASRSFFPANPNGTVPDLDGADRPRNFRASNFYVKDGSYLRLKNVQLNYNVPQQVCKTLKLDQLTVYVGAYNLLTFTKYNGFDPEVGRNVGSESNNLYMGVDHGNYPQARTITAGIKVGL
ncbi:MAG TPA: TonB-dependent receptor [Paludibacter sp.]|nr:TonB-dependent receptor [Paludibacter sp.]